MDGEGVLQHQTSPGKIYGGNYLKKAQKIELLKWKFTRKALFCKIWLNVFPHLFAQQVSIFPDWLFVSMYCSSKHVSMPGCTLQSCFWVQLPLVLGHIRHLMPLARTVEIQTDSVPKVMNKQKSFLTNDCPHCSQAE